MTANLTELRAEFNFALCNTKRKCQTAKRTSKWVKDLGPFSHTPLASLFFCFGFLTFLGRAQSSIQNGHNMAHTWSVILLKILPLVVSLGQKPLAKHMPHINVSETSSPAGCPIQVAMAVRYLRLYILYAGVGVNFWVTGRHESLVYYAGSEWHLIGY